MIKLIYTILHNAVTGIFSLISGLFYFIKIVFTIITYIPKGFKAILQFFEYLISAADGFPAGIATLAICAIACGIIYVILGR